MRVAITGGAGFLGLASAIRLASDGHEVRALNRSAPSPRPGIAYHKLSDGKNWDDDGTQADGGASQL